MNRNQHSRKQLLRKWDKERRDAFLKAESAGKIKEVPGGWLIKGHFMEKMPLKGDILTSYLQMLAECD